MIERRRVGHNGVVHDDLRSALMMPSGLVLVAGPTGQGKTTAIEEVLALPACPPNVAFVGDVRGDREHARDAVSTARSSVVVAVVRIQRAAGAFLRLLDMGVPAAELAEVARTAFTTRLFRSTTNSDTPETLLLHERLAVTEAIRALITAGADPDAVHQQAIDDGMRSLRQLGLDHVKAGRLTLQQVDEMIPADSKQR